MSNVDSDPAHEPFSGSNKWQKNSDVWKEAPARKKSNFGQTYTVVNLGVVKFLLMSSVHSAMMDAFNKWPWTHIKQILTILGVGGFKTQN